MSSPRMSASDSDTRTFSSISSSSPRISTSPTWMAWAAPAAVSDNVAASAIER